MLRQGALSSLPVRSLLYLPGHDFYAAALCFGDVGSLRGEVGEGPMIPRPLAI